MDVDITNAVAVGRNWLTATTLPLWLDHGFDRETGLFHERLDLSARPLIEAPKRLMVQGRQIFVYARASALGWIDGAPQATRAFWNMVAAYREADGHAGWVFSLGSDGRVMDDRRDLYAHAFVLLSCAALFDLTKDKAILGVADEILALLDQLLADPRGGYRDGEPATAGFRQNPHMHLFEALLTLFNATGHAHYLDRAAKLHDLLATRFFLAGPDILAEYFDEEWRPIAEDPSWSSVLWEPGHHCEWVWLLDTYARIRSAPNDPISEALYNRAYRDGITPEGMIVDEMTSGGQVAKQTRRAWPLTEAIKANAIRHENGDTAAVSRALKALHVLQRDFLTPEGLWRDHLSADSVPLHTYVPASTLYHVFMAMTEADRVFGDTPPSQQPKLS